MKISKRSNLDDPLSQEKTKIWNKKWLEKAKQQLNQSKIWIYQQFKNLKSTMLELANTGNKNLWQIKMLSRGPMRRSKIWKTCSRRRNLEMTCWQSWAMQDFRRQRRGWDSLLLIRIWVTMMKREGSCHSLCTDLWHL